MPSNASPSSPPDAPRPYVLGPEERRRFEADGYLITPPLFDASTLEAVRVEIERVWAARNEAIAREGGRGAASKADYSRARPELARLHLESPLLDAFCRHPALVELAGALIGPDVDLSWNQAYTKAPGGDPRTEIPWHQDAWYAEVEGASYNGWVAITEATIENGTIVRAPRPTGEALLPHVWDARLLFYRCEIDEASAEPIVLRPGQAFLFDGRVPHRSGANVSSASRASYSISFSSASARLRANGETFGDRIPVLRGGRSTRAILHEHLRAPDAAAESLLAEIERRAPARRDDVRRAFEAFREAAAQGGEAELGRLLAILPDAEEAMGDLLRARARVDQLLRELAVVRGTDPRVEGLLVDRILTLEPEHATARAERARLASLA